jgi:hypothetical protein
MDAAEFCNTLVRIDTMLRVERARWLPRGNDDEPAKTPRALSIAARLLSGCDYANTMHTAKAVRLSDDRLLDLCMCWRALPHSTLPAAELNALFRDRAHERERAKKYMCGIRNPSAAVGAQACKCLLRCRD